MKESACQRALLGGGWAFGIVSCAASLWLLWWPPTPNGLCYSVRALRTTVVSAQRPPGLRVFAPDGEVHGPISAAEVVLWNAGRNELRSAEVLEPLRLVTERASPILEVSFHPFRQEAAVSVRLDSAHPERADLELNRLAPGDGGAIQVVYQGEPRSRLALEGRIAEQGRLHRFDAPEGVIYRREFNRAGRRAFEFYAYAVILFGLGVLKLLEQTSQLVRRQLRSWKAIGSGVVILVCLAALLVLGWAVRSEYREPPGGF